MARVINRTQFSEEPHTNHHDVGRSDSDHPGEVADEDHAIGETRNPKTHTPFQLETSRKRVLNGHVKPSLDDEFKCLRLSCWRADLRFDLC